MTIQEILDQIVEIRDQIEDLEKKEDYFIQKISSTNAPNGLMISKGRAWSMKYSVDRDLYIITQIGFLNK